MQKGYGENLNYSPISDEILTVMTEGYFPIARYLKSAKIAYDSEEFVHSTGEFEIDSCCYCSGTGHFNHPEFSLCFNQLCYVTIAAGIHEKHFLELGINSVEEFLAAQRNRCFISRSGEISFRQLLNPKKFSGKLRFTHCHRRLEDCFYHIDCSFLDLSKSVARGSFSVRISKKPVYPDSS